MQLKNLLKPRSFWLAWISWLSIVLFIHGQTMLISPPIWQDEVQIIEWGRTVIEPGTDWSINWNAYKNSAVVYPLYLGGLIQNIVFSLSGHNILAPRLLSNIGALVASTSCLALLLSYGHSRLRSSLLSSIFLLDPLFVAGYRGNRIDSWAMALAFLSCLALVKAVGSVTDRRISGLALLLSGSLGAIGLMLWASFILLLPLIAWQAINTAVQSNWKRLLQDRAVILTLLAYWFAGFVICVFLIQLPILLGQAGSFLDLFSAVSRVTKNSNATASILSFFAAFSRNPLLLVLTVLCLFSRPRLDLLLFSGLALAGILHSSTYTHRVVYVLPYFILVCSYSLDRSHQLARLGAASLLVKAQTTILWLSLLASIVISLILRPLNAIETIDFRQSSSLDEVAMRAIGEGHHKVLIGGPWEFYVSGRKLGWKMYNPFFGRFSRSDIRKMDYLILGPNDASVSPSDREDFTRVGSTWLDFPSKAEANNSLKSSGYGPYLIYKNNIPSPGLAGGKPE